MKYVDPDGRSVNIPLPSLVMELRQVGQKLKNASPQLAIVGCIFLGVVLIFEGINYAQNQSLSSSLAKINSASASIVAGAPAPMPPDDSDSKGTRVSSQTLYNKKGIHIDVETPGHRPGQIHVQQGNSKYYMMLEKKLLLIRQVNWLQSLIKSC